MKNATNSLNSTGKYEFFPISRPAGIFERYTWIFVVMILLSCSLISCNKSQDPQIIADFTIQIDEFNLHKVHFINNSENAKSYIWDFDNGDSSNIENPTYTYSSAGIYEVTLLVYGVNEKTDSKTRTLVLNEIPVPPVSMLSGRESKTWKLYRVGAAASLGPDSSRADLWWPGLRNDGSRSCLYKHEFILKRIRPLSLRIMEYSGETPGSGLLKIRYMKPALNPRMITWW
jgi:hypothetical protein